MDDKKQSLPEKKRLFTIAVSEEIHKLVKSEAKKTQRTVGVTAKILIEEGLKLRG
tara:strand:+ start:249 stop:413 length:165 start_codon:yes stop_codon:yes gene_type:complete